MPDLSTTYMGLNLKNPIIAASSGLTKSVDKIMDCYNSGVGAIVMKSLFEEVLAQADFGIGDSATFHTEAYDYMRSELELQYGPRDYLDIISGAKTKVDIPIIASINCVSAKYWPQYAKQIEDAGADALELNIFKTATSIHEDGQALENMYYEIIENVKKQVSIPVALKIGVYFSALPHFAAQLARRGANALVLFNRFTEPDIDIDKISLTTTFGFSNSYDLYKPLRWTALLAGEIGCDIAATTGVKSGKDVIKLLLAGASAVHIASLFYQKGVDQTEEILKELTGWMTANHFGAIDEFKGNLSFKHSQSPDAYLRAQFMKTIRGVE